MKRYSLNIQVIVTELKQKPGFYAGRLQFRDGRTGRLMLVMAYPRACL
jgi:hypothetical protein